MSNICNMCSFDAHFSNMRQCELCGHAAPNSSTIICSACAAELNECMSCRMDMDKSESAECLGSLHLQLAGACGGCQSYATVEELNVHETIAYGRAITRSLDLVIHQWVFISLLGTGTTGSHWLVDPAGDDYVDVHLDNEKCIGIRATRIGQTQIKLITDSAKTDVRLSFDFTFNIINPRKLPE